MPRHPITKPAPPLNPYTLDCLRRIPPGATERQLVEAGVMLLAIAVVAYALNRIA